MNTPVLLITFNRPSHTRQVLEKIREARPKDFFIFQDGARISNPNDVEKIKSVRKVIKELVDWPCNLSTYYSEANLGCGPGPAAAITWFFNNVDKGIIIEDDAIPHVDFFNFAEDLLIKYALDEDIYAIGSMKNDSRKYGDGSYYFSKMNHTLCAWASWRRAWEKFDIYLTNVSEKGLNAQLKKYGARLKEREYWCDRLEEIHKDCYGYSSWDQQFWITIWMNNGKGILPNVNLCKNIGFDQEGTHTIDPNNSAANVNTESIFPIIHPTESRIDKKADLNFQKTYFQPWEYGVKGIMRTPFRINKRIKKALNHEGSWIKRKG